MFKYLKDLFFGKPEVEVKEATKPIVQPSAKVKSDRIKQNQTPATKSVKKAAPSVNKATTKQSGSTNTKKK